MAVTRAPSTASPVIEPVDSRTMAPMSISSSTSETMPTMSTRARMACIVDALHDRVDVDVLEHRVEVDLSEEGVDVDRAEDLGQRHALHDRADVDALDHRVDHRGDHAGDEVGGLGPAARLLEIGARRPPAEERGEPDERVADDRHLAADHHRALGAELHRLGHVDGPALGDEGHAGRGPGHLAQQGRLPMALGGPVGPEPIDGVEHGLDPDAGGAHPQVGDPAAQRHDAFGRPGRQDPDP